MTVHNSYNELCAYTLSQRDPRFIHQHVVDAFAAQHANQQTKPIALTFALVGLYLHIEKRFSGKQVQLVHTKLANRRPSWPTFVLPADRGSITAEDVMLHPPGPERDQSIEAWCSSVWKAFRNNSQTIANLLRQNEIV